MSRRADISKLSLAACKRDVPAGSCGNMPAAILGCTRAACGTMPFLGTGNHSAAYLQVYEDRLVTDAFGNFLDLIRVQSG